MFFIDFSWGISPPTPPDRRARRSGFLVYAIMGCAYFLATDERENLKNYGGRKIGVPHIFLSLAYKKRKTIGQFTTKPVEPYLAPPGPVIQPCSTRPRIWNSSDTLERMPLLMASFVHSPAFTSHNGL